MDNFNNHYSENQNREKDDKKPIEQNQYSQQNNGYTNPYNNQNRTQFQQPVAPTNYVSSNKPVNNHFVTPTVKEDKKGKKFSLKSLIAVTVCSSLLCGVISAGAVALVSSQYNNNQQQMPQSASSEISATNTTDKTITIEDTTENIASAVSQKASNSVVGISVKTTTYNPFYGNVDSGSEGSGVIYTNDGYVITNYHVISDAVDSQNYGTTSPDATITVYLTDDLENGLDAKIIGYDSSIDIAVLKVEGSNLNVAEIGDSAKLGVGEKVFAIGNPGGLEFMGSISQGIVSGLNRSITTETSTQVNLIQTDAAINPGNSGGALVNSKGQLIGINNSKMSGENFEGMGFAIPINEVVETVDNIIDHVGQPQPYMGVTINTNYSSEKLIQMGYPAGVVIYSVAQNSPAQQVGLQQNDIITAINGKKVTSYVNMISEKNKYSIGEEITVTIFREGKNIDYKLTLAQSGQ